MKKTSTMKRLMSYKRHTIYIGKSIDGDIMYCVALKRDGTDDCFESHEDAMEAIDQLEEGKRK